MSQAFEAKAPPLTENPDGVILVVGTRVPLETVVTAFDAGATPEEITQQYPSLGLGDVYAVIAHVLANRETVDAYVAQRRAAGAVLRAEIEQGAPLQALRARLLARRSADSAQ
jgi:uncharacterized protein (DUF433 family)